jgi:hypothetical protein
MEFFSTITHSFGLYPPMNDERFNYVLAETID